MPSATRVRAFILVFTIFFLAALALVIAGEFSDIEWIKVVLRIGQGLGRLIFVATAATFIIVEGVPMLASWIRRQEINQAREEGRVEGHAEGRIEGHAEGRIEGRTEGHTEGHAEGRTEGHAEGRIEGRTQEREAWREWIRRLEDWEERKEAAVRDGRSFTERRPPPPVS